jgi:ferredoxin-NADP reductase
LLCSSRAFPDVIYRDELERLAGAVEGVDVAHTLTRSRPPEWTGYSRRVDDAMLAEVAWPADERPLAYVCGPTRFVEAVADGLLALGYEGARVRTERFGPTGGGDGR